MADGQYMELKLSQVVPGNNYRKHYDKQKMKEMVASIKEHGVIQPVIVRKKGKQFELVVGYRRYIGSNDAGQKIIPALVRDLTDIQVAEIQAIENIQREDPNPMDEAVGFKDLLDLGKYTIDSLAKRFGKGKSYVYQRLKLNDMPKDCQRALQDGKIDLGHATQLCRLSDKKDMSDLLRDILDQDMSPSQLKGHIQSEYGVRLAPAVFDQASCHKCPNNSVTQASLFPGVEADDAKCMDEKCFRRKSMEMLEAMAGKFNAQGYEIIRDPKEVEAVIRKGSIISPQTPIKAKCKTCKTRVFFFAELHNMVHMNHGWHCTVKKCYDEIYLGIVPRKKEQTSAGASNAKDIRAKQEKESDLWDMDTRFLERWATERVRPNALQAGNVPDNMTLRLQLGCYHLLNHLNYDNSQALLLPYVAAGTEIDKIGMDDEKLWDALKTVKHSDLPELMALCIATVPTRIEPELLRKMLAEHGMDYHKEFSVDKEWLETLDENALGGLCQELNIMVTSDGPLDKPALIAGILAQDIKGKIPQALQQMIGDPAK